MAVFPLLALPPEEQLGISLTALVVGVPMQLTRSLLQLRVSTSADRAAVDVGRWGTPGEAASVPEAPPPGPLPKTIFGCRVGFLFLSGFGT